MGLNQGKRAQALHPERALTAGSWGVALILLALNDHVWKQSGMLPSWVTGKLSDFVGLYVAPALLATLLRVRTHGAFAACHLAIGAVFAAINLDPGCAQLWSELMGLFGFPWHIVTDAEDLIALPALLASYYWLGRAMQRPALEPRRLLRGVRYGFGGFALLCCMATSDDDSWGAFIESGGPHLHNASSETIVVLVRALKPTVQLDCGAIAEDPVNRLPDAAFEPAVAYRLRPHENLGLGAINRGFVGGGAGTGGTPARPAVAQSCGAARITGSDLRPATLFWNMRDVPRTSVPRVYDRRSDYRDGAVILRFKNRSHTGYESIGGDFVFEPRRPLDEVGEGCALPDEGQRPVISAGLPSGWVRLERAEQGPDGCVALSFSRLTGVASTSSDLDAGAPDDDEDAGTAPVGGAPAYVCVPVGMFPFAVGDEVNIDARFGSGQFQMTKGSASSGEQTVLTIEQLGSVDFIAGLDFQIDRREACGFVVDEDCAQTAVAVDVVVRSGGDRITVRSGDDPRRFENGGREIEMAVPFARERILMDTACARGSTTIGPDATVVTVVRWGKR